MATPTSNEFAPITRSRSVTTPKSQLTASSETPSKTDTVQTEKDTRVVQTNTLSTTIGIDTYETWKLTEPDEMDLVDTQEVTERTTALHDLLDDPSPSRVVATREVNRQQPPDTSDSQTVAIKEQAIDRESNVIEVAKTLLQLHGTKNTDITEENEQLLPVDAPKQPDVVKEMAHMLGEALPDLDQDTLGEALPDLDQDQDDNNYEPDDDNATIIYEPPVTSTPEDTQMSSPKKGEVTFKHYGIKRRSPRIANIRKHRCILCSK